MNQEIASYIQVNQWKNSSAVIKWFRNIEKNKTVHLLCSISRTFTRQFRYHYLTKQLNLERLDQGSSNFQQPTISKGSYRISSIICKTNRVVLQQIKMKSRTGSQNLVRVMRLVSCCTNWSKSNLHLM